MSEHLPPLLSVLYSELRIRGWEIAPGYFIDPEGNRWGNIEAAITAQTMREITLGPQPSEGT